MTRSLAFLSTPRPPDYGSHFSRLRWRCAVAPARVATWEGTASARESLAGSDSWVVVLEGSALPAPRPVPEAFAGTILIAEAAAPANPPFVHTLRELEGAELAPAGLKRTDPAALVFRSADFPPAEGETVADFLARLTESREAASGAGFQIIRFEDPSERERPELVRRLPLGSVRILDVGCGAGGGVAGARARNTGWHVTGIERDPVLARRARERCDRVLEGDLREVLPRLASDGERFDALVFADVLEHVEDPIAALADGRKVAAPGATLVVSVPNVGHVSIVRDLIAGRFDPLPAGLSDAGHVRWFTRSGLSEALEEAGWRTVSIDGEAGAPAPDAAEFLERVSAWEGVDRESLRTYQWIAVCRTE